MSLDLALVLAVVLAAAAWLGVRAVRAVRGRGGCGCGKPEAAPCPQAGSIVEAVRAAARRAGSGSPPAR